MYKITNSILQPLTYLCVIVVFVLNTGLSLPVLARGGGTLPKISARGDVDENLFLVMILEELYNEWPSDLSDSDSFISLTSELRKQALSYKIHIKQNRHLDDELADRFSDFIEALDTYISFLGNIELLEASAVRQLQQDNFESGFKGGYAGGLTFDTLSQSDNVTFGEAAMASLAIGGVTYLIDAWEKEEARNEAMRLAVEAEERRVNDNIYTALLKAQTTARSLGKKYGWGGGEIGWDISGEEGQILERILQDDDPDDLILFYEHKSKSRPRDPTPRLIKNYLILLLTDNPEVLMECALDSYDAASLIPDASIYDKYRLNCVSLAARLAFAARMSEFRAGKSVTGSTIFGRIAVELWSKVLEMDPIDITGEVRESLTLALMGIGELKEAQRYANDIVHLRRNSYSFCYNYACLMSRLGYSQKSLEWLEHSIKLGNYDVIYPRKDPDLEFVRREKEKQFMSLLIPKYSWRVSDDWLWDDVTLVNKSAFPITGVTLSVSLRKGNVSKSLQLDCDYLGPGEEKVWSDVVGSVEGGWGQASTATLHCDQD